MVTEMAMRGEPWRRQEEEQAEADQERELELELFRSGSAPPTVEGSMGVLHGAAADVFLEDDLRADPAYHSYYYSNGNINPRLPLPLLSKEDWRSAQRLRSGSGLGGIDDGRRGGGGGGAMGHGDGLIGMPGLEIGRQKSFSGLFQDDMYQHDTDRHGANCNSTDLLGSSRIRYGLHHETGAIGGLQFDSKAPCLPENQNNESSHTYASIIGSSLSRSASPDPELVRLLFPSPLIPDGGKGGAAVRRTATTTATAAASPSAEGGGKPEGAGIPRTLRASVDECKAGSSGGKGGAKRQFGGRDGLLSELEFHMSVCEVPTVVCLLGFEEPCYS